MTPEQLTEIFGPLVYPVRGKSYGGEEFLEFDSACDRVAFPDGTGFHLGPWPMSHFCDPEVIGFQRDSRAGQYYLAREQIVRCIMSGQMPLFGVVAVSGRPEAGLVAVKIRPDIIEDPDLFDEDVEVTVRNVSFELLLVRLADLERLFTFGPPIREVFSRDRQSVGGERRLPSGRPPKWDWDWFWAELVLLANTPDGLPPTQAEAERWAGERFLEKYGAEPAASLVRKKLGPVYQRFRSQSR